eukprot:929800-Pyramimonas_sp.AAC.2
MVQMTAHTVVGRYNLPVNSCGWRSTPRFGVASRRTQGTSGMTCCGISQVSAESQWGACHTVSSQWGASHTVSSQGGACRTVSSQWGACRTVSSQW